jgi:hypothetical protein
MIVRRNIRWAVIPIAISMLIGCYAGKTYWTRDGNFNESDFERDKEICRQQMMAGQEGGAALGTAMGALISQSLFGSSSLSRCMNAKGYREVKQGS